MANPYNHPFLKRQNTMYLSSIHKQDFPGFQLAPRQSSFLKHDIEGSKPRQLIPKQSNISNFSLSTFIEPGPNYSRSVVKKSDPLFIDDIEGCRPRVRQFRTKRVVNPLNPRYILPSASAMLPDKGRPFFRDTLEISDINSKRPCKTQGTGSQAKFPIEGASPKPQTKQLHSPSKFQVKDINKQYIFQSNRTANPLLPNYVWRDNPDKTLNSQYGKIEGSQVRVNHPAVVDRRNNLCLQVGDIEGSKANSTFLRTHFIDKRRQFRDYMRLNDIQKCGASSLKKGITTIRQTNPLMPDYKYPGNKQSNDAA